ncbi:restriction endonuclease [Rhodococcus sp. NPDC004095]
MQIVTPADAELFAAQHMRGLGYTDAEAKPGGPDGGVDVRSSRAIAQVKLHAKPCGRPDLQRLYGARGDDHGKEMVFYSHSGYSAAAVDYANTVGMTLFQFDRAGNVIRVGSGGHLGRVAGTPQVSSSDDDWAAAERSEKRADELKARIATRDHRLLLERIRSEMDQMSEPDAVRHMEQLKPILTHDGYKTFKKEYFKTRRSRERYEANESVDVVKQARAIAIVVSAMFALGLIAMIVGNDYSLVAFGIFPVIAWGMYWLVAKQSNDEAA